MKAIVLGGVAPHISLIERLKNRGFEVILIDYLDDPPAKKHRAVRLPAAWRLLLLFRRQRSRRLIYDIRI